MSLQYDTEFALAVQPFFAAMASFPQIPAHDVAARRQMLALLDTTGGDPTAISPGVVWEKYSTRASDGHEIVIHRFSKETKDVSAAKVPAVVHAHGGGLFALGVTVFARSLANFVSSSGTQIFSVEYRLAPEHPYPIPVEDCYAGLLWVQENCAKFNIDPARIGVMGESAGAGLAAAMTLLARDRHFSPPLAKQILMCPMLDDRNLSVDPALEPLAIWKSADNITGWTAYLGEKAGKDGVSPFSAPARVENVEGLPSIYIDVGGLDIFCKESLSYAVKFAEASIQTEFHLYPGLPHGFEGLGPTCSSAQVAFANRLKAISSI